MLVLSAILLRTSVTNGLAITETFSKRLLAEITYTLEFTNDMVEGVAVELFLDSANARLLYDPNPGEFEVQRAINRLYRQVVANPALFSVTLFNRSAGRLYNAVETGADTDDPYLRDTFHSGNLPPPLRPIPRRYEPGVAGISVPVITYFAYEPTSAGEVPFGAIVVNANVDWLTSNLARFTGKGARLVIVDRQGRIVASGGDTSAVDADTLGHYLALMETDSPTYRSETVRLGAVEESARIISLDGERRVVTAAQIPGTDWYLVNDQSYHDLFATTERMRRTMMWIAASFLMLAGVVSIVVSRQIYKPIGRLVRHVRQSEVDRSLPPGLDDAEYLSRAFDRQQASLDRLSETQEEAARLSRELLVKRVVLEGQPIDDDVGLEPVRLVGLRWSAADDDTPVASNTIAEPLSAILGQAFAETHRVQIVTTQGDLLVYLLTRCADQPIVRQRQVEAFNAVRRSALASLSIHLAVFVAPEADSIKRLHESFPLLQGIQPLSIMRGLDVTVFVEDQLERPSEAKIEHRNTLADRILVELKEQSPDEAVRLLDEYLDCVAEATVAFFTFSLIELAITINGYLTRLSGDIEAEQDSVHPVDYDIVIHPKSRAAIRAEFVRAFDQITERLHTAAINRASAIAESIVAFVHDSYSDPALCLKSIAAEFQMSPSRLGHLFKQQQGVSVADYINDVRLEHVRRLLGETRISIKEIMERVGFVNESNFYKRFKRQYGVTPARYRTSLSIEQLAARSRPQGDD